MVNLFRIFASGLGFGTGKTSTSQLWKSSRQLRSTTVNGKSPINKPSTNIAKSPAGFLSSIQAILRSIGASKMTQSGDQGFKSRNETK